MTDNEKPDRPNSNYKLSGENISIHDEENLTFYYNRERRLAKAPQSVRKLYEMPAHKFNLLQPLIADKPRATIFFTIIIMVVVIIILALLGYFDKAYKMDGNKIEISSEIFEDTSIIFLKKRIDRLSRNNSYTGEVDIGVSPVQSDMDIEDLAIFTHRVYFTYEQEEEYRFVVPYNTEKLVIVLQTEKSTLKITVTSK